MARKKVKIQVEPRVSGKPMRGISCIHNWVSHGGRKGEFKCSNCPATCVKDRNGKIEEYDTHAVL
jgi:hypothetical protein